MCSQELRKDSHEALELRSFFLKVFIAICSHLEEECVIFLSVTAAETNKDNSFAVNK